MTFDQLTPGRWYAIGFELFSFVDTPRIDYGQIVKYHGDRDFTDDCDEQVVAFWDPELQMPVAVDAADDYAEQA